MPRRRNARCSTFALASSSRGRSCGSISTIITSAPNERHTDANSTPITPPPRMIADLGTRSSRSASSEEMIRSPSIVRPGSDLGTEPVASTMWSPV
jgi:hypothetical protein